MTRIWIEPPLTVSIKLHATQIIIKWEREWFLKIIRRWFVVNVESYVYAFSSSVRTSITHQSKFLNQIEHFDIFLIVYFWHFLSLKFTFFIMIV